MGGTLALPSNGKQEGTSKYPGLARGAIADSRQERAACPLYTAIGVIEGRWKPMLFQRLSWRPHGFGELRRAMPGVSSKVLREQLRQMEADGLIAKRALSPAHAGVRYRLTPYGRTLGPVFNALWQWGTKHLRRPNAHAGTMVNAPVTSSEAESITYSQAGTTSASMRAAARRRSR
jgi:DNA-binding HxlR family transcriptional regulator